MFFSKAQVIPVLIDLFRQNPAGIMPLPNPEPLRHRGQILRLVIGAEREALKSGPIVRRTDVQLRTLVLLIQ
jgi:hypothetical protein